MSKIRILKDTPVLNDSGAVIHAVEMAGPSSEAKPTSGLANGSLFLESDTGKIAVFDEDNGWGDAR